MGYNSGHETAKVLDSLPTFERLFGTKSALLDDDVWGLTIMPGSGINTKTIAPVVKHLLPKGLREIHLSAGDWVDGVMKFRKEGMGMGVPGHEWSVWKTREKELKKVRYAADTTWDEYWEEALQANEGGVVPGSESESESDAS
jgi:copper homeostasis protein